MPNQQCQPEMENYLCEEPEIQKQTDKKRCIMHWKVVDSCQLYYALEGC